jgi:thiol:disulfide interchange protein DsbD
MTDLRRVMRILYLWLGIALAIALVISWGKARAETEATGGGGLFEVLERLGGPSGKRDFLPPERAFPFTYTLTGDGRLVLRIGIAPGYYLYREKFRFTADSDAVAVGQPVYPEAEIKDDPHFGPTPIFRHPIEVPLPLLRRPGLAGPVTLTVGFQGCAEDGICYPPMQQPVPLPADFLARLAPAGDAPGTATPGTASPGTASPPGPGITSGTASPGTASPLGPGTTSDPAIAATRAATATAPAPPAPALSEVERLAARLATEDRGMVLLSFLGLGLLLTFTPCVFPMIPILSGIVVGEGHRLTPRRAFSLSLAYVLAMAAAYAIAGVAAGLLGKNLQAAFQAPWILIAFSAVFVGLALSMFGLFELQLPTALQSRIGLLSHRQRGGTLLGAGIMGFLSAIIVGPCVAPPLAGALLYISQSGDPLLGGAALFALGLGMGIPLLVVGTSAGSLLPRAGGWMEAVKRAFGVILLGVAVWMLERLLPGPLVLALWALLLICSAVFLGACEPLDAVASGWRRLAKGAGLALLLYGGALMLGAAAGASDPLKPLGGIPWIGVGQARADPDGRASATAPAFVPVRTLAGLQAELARAKAAGRPALVDYYADWCVECKEMERRTFADPRVRQALAAFHLVRADVTANDDEAKALLDLYGLLGPPVTLFFGADGVERKAHRLQGFLSAEEFLGHLRAIAAP